MIDLNQGQPQAGLLTSQKERFYINPEEDPPVNTKLTVLAASILVMGATQLAVAADAPPSGHPGTSEPELRYKGAPVPMGQDPSPEGEL